MKLFFQGIVIFCGLVLFWEFLVIILQLPAFILPPPYAVIKILLARADLLLMETKTTLIETLLGLALGIFLGCLAGLCMALFKPAAKWLWPLLILSQAIPTFAIAPLLVIWFGYGMASKIVVTIIMLFFPITTAFYDGLRATNVGWLDLANTMNASKWRIFWHIRIPAALPRLSSGIRVATAIAPIGAIVGEWVGASSGLGYLMLNANARMQIDLMFAALFIIIMFSLLLYFAVDYALRKLIYWEK